MKQEPINVCGIESHPRRRGSFGSLLSRNRTRVPICSHQEKTLDENERVTDGMSEKECTSLRADLRVKGRSGHKLPGSSEPLSEEVASGGSR